MKNAAIYMRVSTDRQAKEGDSIPAQRSALRQYIDNRPDLVFAGEYLDDGISGTKYDRDELQRLISDVEAGKIDLVCVTKMDRLHRSLRNFLNMQEVFDRNHCAWVAIWEPMYDTTTPQGRMVVNTMMNLAQFEAEQTGQRIRQVFAYKVQQGEVISGMACPGYSVVGKHLLPNEDAPNVVYAFTTYQQTGCLNETMRICDDLPGLPRTKPAFKRMLSNEKYIGTFRTNPDYCPGIIDKATFDDVQRKLSMNIKANQKYQYIFTGLLVCADCGKKLGGVGRLRHPQHGTYKERLYRCPRAFFAPPACENRKQVGEHAIEKILLERIEKHLDALYSIEPQAPIQIDYSAKESAVKRKLKRLKDLYINGLMSIDEYKEDKEALENELECIHVESKKGAHAVDALKDIDLRSLYATFDNDEKRLFWRSIVEQITVDHDRNVSVAFL